MVTLLFIGGLIFLDIFIYACGVRYFLCRQKTKINIKDHQLPPPPTKGSAGVKEIERSAHSLVISRVQENIKNRVRNKRRFTEQVSVVRNGPFVRVVPKKRES